MALANDVELDSFTDVAVLETTESKAKKSKIKTELEENNLGGGVWVGFGVIVELRFELINVKNRQYPSVSL